MVHLIVLMASLSITPPLRAPANPNGNPLWIAALQQQSTAIDRWISRPTPIMLSKAQSVRLDTIRLKYVTERKAVDEEPKTGGDMAAMLKMRALHGKYRKLVRALLTPEQQAVFDKNFQSGFSGPRP